MRKIGTILSILVLLLWSTSNAQNYALEFNGSSNFVAIPDHDNLDLTGDYSVEAWIYCHSFTSGNGIISKYQTGAADGFVIRIGDNQNISFDGLQSPTNSLTANTWHHVAGVVNSGVCYIYIDGSLKTSSSSGYLVTSANSDPLCIGVDYTTRFFDGLIDEVRIWNDARTVTEINNNKNIELTGSESGLVAYYKMSNGSGTTLTDNTGNGHTGTITGATWTVANDLSLPVELMSFSAKPENKSIILEWATASESDNLGFILERCMENSDYEQIASYKTHSDLTGKGTTSSTSQYSFIDNNVTVGKEYTYRLSDVSSDGNRSEIGKTEVKVSAIPTTTQLFAAYPNPFNPSTTLKYNLAKDGHVTLGVFDMLGRQISLLNDLYQTAGEYSAQWDGSTDSGIMAPSGTYLVRLQTGNLSQIQKVILIK